jgi:RNA polymerase sigma-70 factor (ECF subfamily)
MDHGGANWRERAIRDAVLADDASAWRAWFGEHFERLAAYVRWRCCGLCDLADDAIQVTWLTAVRRLRSFDPDRGPFFGWLQGIAANSIRNALRARRRHDRRIRPLGPPDDLAAAGPDHAAIDKAERVAAALAELPEHYEAVLRAKYLERQSVEEIATARGDSLKAVESLLARARQAFREAFERTNHD